jgi:hypothetical protein
MLTTEQNVTYPTPDLRDKLFYEFRRSTVAANKNFIYGEPHPNPDKFPGYKLVYVSPAPTQEAQDGQRWWYAADRLDQEAHSATVSYPYSGLPFCPRIDYSFVFLTKDYAPLAKGTPHPYDKGAETLPEHQIFVGAKLVFEQEIEVPDELKSIYTGVRRIYDVVPTLAQQLDHNYTISYPYAGVSTCPRYTRTLIIPRDEYVAAEKGSADPVYTAAKLIDEVLQDVGDQITESLYVTTRRVYDLVPTIAAQEAYNLTQEFPYQSNTSYPRNVRRYVVPRADLATAVIPSTQLSLTGFSLAFRRHDRFEGQAEDSRYVLVTVGHDKIPNVGNSTDATFLQGFGYRIDRPFGTDDHPQITWRIPAVKTGYVPTADYAACPIPGYTGLLLTNEMQEARASDAGTVDLVRVYSSLPGPELETEIREKLEGIPAGFISSRVTETFRQPVKNDATIDSTSGLPTDVGGGLMRTQLGPEGNNTVIFEKGSTRITVTTGPMITAEYDELTGTINTITREVVAAGTPGSALDPITGLFSTVDQIDQYYAIKTTRRPTALGVGDDAISYEDVINWSWPPVFIAINFFAVEAKDGHIVRYGNDLDFREGYSGPCKALITESWSPTPISVPTLTPMIATPMSFSFPMTSLDIPACLHPEITFGETVGTNHPSLAFAVTSKTFAATTYTDWPDTIVGAVRQSPYRGGFRCQTTLIYKPA